MGQTRRGGRRWAGADGKLGTDKGRQLAETETRSGVGRIGEAGAVEKVRVGVSRGGVAEERDRGSRLMVSRSIEKNKNYRG